MTKTAKWSVRGFGAAMVLLACSAGTPVAHAEGAVLGIGKPAPDFTITDIAGKKQSLKSYAGKIVVLEWVDPECSFSNGKHYQSGNMSTLQKETVGEGVVWLTFNSAAPGKQGDLSGATLTNWLKSVNFSGSSYSRDQDGKVGRLYRATATPDMYVIDKSGKLVYAGAIDSIPSNDIADIPKATNYVRQAVNEVLAGKPVTKPVTRPYGCVIKYADG